MFDQLYGQCYDTSIYEIRFNLCKGALAFTFYLLLHL